MAAPTPAPASAAGRTPRVALICRDDEAGETVTTYIAELGLEPVISQEPKPGASLDVLEGLRQADFGLVLQSDRQLEIGFLLATVGRTKLFVLGDAAIPGLTKQEMDEGGLWRLLLAREMKKAGLDVDLNRAL
jgi:hypothetical protein